MKAKYHGRGAKGHENIKGRLLSIIGSSLRERSILLSCTRVLVLTLSEYGHVSEQYKNRLKHARMPCDTYS